MAMTPDTRPAGSDRPYWNGTAVRSRLFDALSLLLPAGETFLIETLRTWRAQSPALCDAALHDEIERFIREEGAHQRAHARYNATLIAALPGAEAVARRADRVADGLAGLGLPMKIALAAAFEQLTTLVSREIVEHDTLLDDDASQPGRLWRWHAREELGHCDVALAVAARGAPNRWLRRLALVLATGYLASDLVRYTWALCRCDIAAGARRRTLLADALRFAVGSLPAFARMAGGWLRFAISPLGPRGPLHGPA
ncbi:metal-dependent hydrolase (plasmid) [Ralstonia solanacearum]|nr:metal-dependent hydrolase [Ralstonia solanacearum]